MIDPLAGRCAIVTGANQGLGLQIARSYIAAGAHVVLCARDEGKLAEARAAITKDARPGQRVIAKTVDVSDPTQCQALVTEALAALGHLDVLVNNAGVYGPKGQSEEVDWTEWTRAIEINLYGSVLMSRAVVPHFKSRGYGKVVQISGGGATTPLPFISAYAASKAAVIRFAETLAEELRPFRIDVNAIAPGALNTRMLDEVLAAGPENVGADFHRRAVEQRARGGAPLEAAADLAVFLGSAASDGITGKLISAVWDPWDELPAHAAELASSDIYTLRRIVPGDRGKSWDRKK